MNGATVVRFPDATPLPACGDEAARASALRTLLAGWWGRVVRPMAGGTGPRLLEPDGGPGAQPVAPGGRARARGGRSSRSNTRDGRSSRSNTRDGRNSRSRTRGGGRSSRSRTADGGGRTGEGSSPLAGLVLVRVGGRDFWFERAVVEAPGRRPHD